MSLKDKCKLYFMLYYTLKPMAVARGQAHSGAGASLKQCHQIAFKRTNYILTAIGERLDAEELMLLAKTN